MWFCWLQIIFQIDKQVVERVWVTQKAHFQEKTLLRHLYSTLCYVTLEVFGNFEKTSFLEDTFENSETNHRKPSG